MREVLEPRSKLPAIDFSIRWNLFLTKLNGVTRAQAFHKLRASSCTRKLRASPKSRKHFEHKFKSKLIYNERVTQHGGSYGVNQHSSNL